jgi:hypothetical protein
MLIRRITAVGLPQTYIQRLRGDARCSPGEPGPLRRVLAFFDPLFRRAATVVECDKALGGRGRVALDPRGR